MHTTTLNYDLRNKHIIKMNLHISDNVFVKIVMAACTGVPDKVV